MHEVPCMGDLAHEGPCMKEGACGSAHEGGRMRYPIVHSCSLKGSCMHTYLMHDYASLPFLLSPPPLFTHVSLRGRASGHKPAGGPRPVQWEPGELEEAARSHPMDKCRVPGLQLWQGYAAWNGGGSTGKRSLRNAFGIQTEV